METSDRPAGDGPIPDEPSSVKRVMTWVGSITALIGLFASLAGGVHWFMNHRQESEQLKAQRALAESQVVEGDYPAAVASYEEILKGNPMDARALDGELDAAMGWDENFHAVGREGHDSSEAAAPQLDKILALLEAGLVRSKGLRAADVQAHLGWAHWLNSHIAKREYDDAAERNFRAALKTDPSNVYANAMLGNWLMQNDSNFPEAISHFDAAVATGKLRPYVRTMQLVGLLDDETHGARAEIVKAVNDMRKNGETIEAARKHSILLYCCNPPFTDHRELVESLSAVPQEEAWETYLWLDVKQAGGSDEQGQRLAHEFISDSLLEISGNGTEALEKYRALQGELKGTHYSLQDSVNEAIARLSKH
jgi:tetratricopeptide (TPR) repeat protein